MTLEASRARLAARADWDRISVLIAFAQDPIASVMHRLDISEDEARSVVLLADGPLVSQPALESELETKVLSQIDDEQRPSGRRLPARPPTEEQHA